MLSFLFKNISKVLILIFITFFVGNFVFASTNDNVYGWAWSENLGWVSFNCVGDSTFLCTRVGYGINVDKTTGRFEGYAWSENLGWISFEENNLSDYGFNSDCIDSSCNASNNCTACYNYNTDFVLGWAKGLAQNVLSA